MRLANFLPLCILVLTVCGRSYGIVPNDPIFPDQWHLQNTGQDGGVVGADIHTAEAWDITTGSMSTVVAVLDNGVYYDHEDLYLNMYLNQRKPRPERMLLDTFPM